MQSLEHRKHIQRRISHNNCQECRADCERQFLRKSFSEYLFVHEYLDHIKPRLEAIKSGSLPNRQLVHARIWFVEFRKALHRRIGLKVGPQTGRKQCDSYLQRLGQFPKSTNANYLRRFAHRGASTLS